MNFLRTLYLLLFVGSALLLVVPPTFAQRPVPIHNPANANSAAAKNDTAAKAITPVAPANTLRKVAEAEPAGLFGLSWAVAALLIFCLLCAFAFEFVNGFHDTANAVATVIYTKTLQPQFAVVWSGFCNFLGVLTGGIGVAMGIVNLLPVELLTDQSRAHSLAMVFALLFSAIIWNLSTWYLGLPASSSHTLIGAILGLGLAFGYTRGNYDTVNWHKAQEIGLSLLFSPLLGFAVTILLMLLLRWIVRTPKERREELIRKGIIDPDNPEDIHTLPSGVNIFKPARDGKVPPIWIRAVLMLTCTLVSFFHGQNDGQKGVGLVMLILIGIVPTYFALDSSLDPQKMLPNLNKSMAVVATFDTTTLATKEKKALMNIKTYLAATQTQFTGAYSVSAIPRKERFDVRKNIILAEKNFKALADAGNLKISSLQKATINSEFKELRTMTDYAPKWVIFFISVSLGLGTMIGWKRIVVTIGEKIGKQHLSYAQGASAELVAASTIGLSSYFSLPVSTTHVLSSGIAGSMVASKGVKNLQPGTARSILLAWVLTLPVSALLSGGIFLLLRAML